MFADPYYCIIAEYSLFRQNICFTEVDSAALLCQTKKNIRNTNDLGIKDTSHS